MSKFWRGNTTLVLSFLLFIGMTGLAGLINLTTAPPAQAAPLVVPGWVDRLDAPPGTLWPGLMDPAKHYDVYRDHNGRTLLKDLLGNDLDPDDWQAEISTRIAEHVKNTNSMVVSSFQHQGWAIDPLVPGPIMALKGDSISAYGGLGGGQQSSGEDGEPTDQTATGVWSIKNDFSDEGGEVYKFFGEEVMGDAVEMVYTQGSGRCATATPTLSSYRTVWDLWCLGVGTFVGSVHDVDGPKDSDGNYTGYAFNYSLTPLLSNIQDAFDLPLLPVYFTGPNRLPSGANATNPGYFLVFAPSLQLIKEVCATGTGCDPDLVTGDNEPVLDSVDNTTGDWVDAATLPLGSTAVQWRITVKNTGNIDLKDVHLTNDRQSTDPTTQDDQVVDPNDCLSALSVADHVDLAPGESTHVTCTTALSGELDGFIVNEANANASLPESIPCSHSGSSIDQAPIIDENGDPLTARLMGHNEEAGLIPSNNDAAMAGMPRPGLKLTKWVCGDADGCATPAPNSSELTALAGYTLADGVTEGVPAGGWVKATTVPYDSTADWLVVVTNTGDTYLKDVSLSTEAVSGALGNPVPTSATSIALMAPGASGVFRLTSADVTDTGTLGTGFYGSADPKSGERAYAVGGAGVNTAQAQATPANPDGTTMEKGNHQPADERYSNISVAEVNTRAPDASIELLKYVCHTRDDCVPPDSDNVTPTTLADAGWVKQTTVPYDTAARWLLVITNTGDVDLADVTLTKEVLTVGGHGATTAECAQGTVVVSLLEAGKSHLVTCTTADITNTGDLGGGGVINTARASGEPVDDDGDPLPPPDGGDEPWVEESEEDSAEVNTRAPAPGLKVTKWVCVLGTGCDAPNAADLERLSGVSLDSDGAVVVVAGQPTTQWAKETTVSYNTSAEWLVVVGNTGTTHLSNVYLVLENTIGVGKGLNSAVTPSAVALMAPGASVGFRLSTASITNTHDYVVGHDGVVDPDSKEPGYRVGQDVVNSAQAQATPAKSNGDPFPVPNGTPDQMMPDVVSNVSAAEANTRAPGPSLALTKWVCLQGTGCSTPSATNAALLADGFPAGGWVKETTVAYGHDAQWLLVVKNTGDTRIKDVLVSVEQLTGTGHGALTGCAVNDVVASYLDVGEVAVLASCLAPTITNDHPYVPGAPTGEDVVNTAQVKGSPVDDEGDPIPKPNDEPGNIDDIESNEDAAEVNTGIPAPELKLTKWVCAAGTGCTTPDPAALVTLGNGSPAGGWIKLTTVDYLTDAEWLIVIKNTGNVRLDNVKLSEEYLSPGGHDPLIGCAPNQIVTTRLDPGQSVAVTGCVAPKITSQDSNVVNTAQSVGTPVDNQGVPLVDPDDLTRQMLDQYSNRDNAAVNTRTPTPDVRIDKYDVLDGDDIVTGHYPETAKLLPPETDVPIEFKITNTGTDDLINITVVDITTFGVGKVENLSCDFSPLGGPASGTTWEGPLLVSKAFFCTGTLPGLSPDQKHTDKATVTAEGLISGEPVTDDDVWNGNATPWYYTGGTAAQDAILQRSVLAGLLAVAMIGVIVVPLVRKRLTR